MLKFFRFPSQTRLLPVYLIALLLVIGIGVVALVKLNQINRTLDILTSELAVDRALSKDIISQILLMRFYANRYVRTQGQADLDNFNDAFAYLEALLARADRLITDLERAAMLQRISSAVETYGATFDDVNDLVQDQQRVYAEVIDIQGLVIENALTAMRIHIAFLDESSVALAFGNTQAALHQMHVSTTRYLEEGDEKYAVLFASSYEDARKLLDDLETRLQDPEQRSRVDEMRASLHTFYQGFQIIRADYARLRELLATMFDDLEPEISATASEISASIDREFQREKASSKILIRQTRFVLIVVTTSAVLAGLGLGSLLNRYIQDRHQAEEVLRGYQEHLEHLVEARTAELRASNLQLRREISDRERVEVALRESEARLAQAQEIAHIGSWSMDVIEDRLVWSDEMYRLLGLTSGDPAHPSLDLGISRTHPEDREPLMAKLDACMKRGDVEFETEFRTVPIGGHSRILQVQARLERDAEGRVTRIFGIDVDVTERRRAERALRRSEENFRQIFEANPFPMLISRRTSGDILMANQAMVDHLGVPRDQLLKKSAVDFYVDLSDRDTIVQELEQHGQVLNRIVHIKTESRGERVMLLNILSIERDGEMLQLAGSADITAQIEAENAARAAKIAAEEANRAKSVFLANMSHELRTPLNAVLGFSQLMARDLSLTPEQRDNLEIIQRSGEHLLALINDVLDLSRIEAGRIDVQPEVFDLHEMLLGLGEMFSLRADRKGLTVVFDLAPDVPQYIRADAGKLRQVLINLLGNAVKFTERGGVTMTLEMCAPASSSQGASAERAGAAGDLSLHFEVQDTGVGIASDELDQLFDAFVQTESGRRSRQGTGLGLPISRQYVRMMGGDLTVRSEVGKGSCFAFDLGFATPTPDDVAALERGGFHRKIRVDITPDQVTPEGEVYRILVVDDVASSRWLLEKLLTPLGFAVRTAIDGQQGLALWEAWRPHLIFMDMRMPVMDGRTTTRLIKVRSRKAVSAEPEPVVVALTSSAFEADRADILAAGCDDFIPKPFRDVMIYEVLERHLGVQFNYVDSPEGGGLSRDARSLSQRELVAGLAAQPEALRKHLAAAALNGDIERLEQLIDKIGERNMALAETLDALAYDFAYDEIIRLVEEVDGV